jgi:hypothetical protein
MTLYTQLKNATLSTTVKLEQIWNKEKKFDLEFVSEFANHLKETLRPKLTLGCLNWNFKTSSETLYLY